jgi:hypothetical protein
MSFALIAEKYQKDEKLPDPQRTYELNLLTRVVAPDIMGGIYDIPRGTGGVLYPFHKEFIGKEFLPIFKRRPNVPEGTMTLRNQISRQAMLVFGAERFPQIETANAEGRKILNDFIKEAEVQDRFREAVVLGSVGSVAMHVRVLAPPGKESRIFIENYPTAYLTPKYDPYRPDTLIQVTEKYRISGLALAKNGYDIPKDKLSRQYWFMRIWDINSEVWYTPWTDDDEIEDGFAPSIDITNTVDHDLGFCPWLWIKNIPIGKRVDGVCQFREALDHAINLDYLESQIVAAVKYTMAPTMVIEQDAKSQGPAQTPVQGEGSATVKSPSTILIIDSTGKAYYLEISGEGIEVARQVAADLRKAIVEACHGERIDPEKVTQAHQGAKTIMMMNQPLIGLCDQLRSSYGKALERLLKMVVEIVKVRAGKNYPGVMINGDVIDPAVLGDIRDLDLNWGVYYADTPGELMSEASAMDMNLRNGLLSRERAMTTIAGTYKIDDVDEEMAKVKQDQAENDARAIALAQATAQVKVNDNISNG